MLTVIRILYNYFANFIQNCVEVVVAGHLYDAIEPAADTDQDLKNCTGMSGPNKLRNPKYHVMLLEPSKRQIQYICIRCGTIRCNKCSSNVLECVTCARRGVEPHTTTAEDHSTVAATEVTLPCRNHRRGCNESFLQSKKAQKMYHEKNCRHIAITCPISRDCDGLTTREIFKHIILRHGVKASMSKRINIIAIQNLQSLVKRDTLTYTRVFVHDLNFFKFQFSMTKYDISVDILVQKLKESTNTSRTTKRYRTNVEFKTKFETNRFSFILTQDKKKSANWKYDISRNNSDSIEIYIAIDTCFGNNLAVHNYLNHLYYNEIPRPYNMVSSMMNFEIANDSLT